MDIQVSDVCFMTSGPSHCRGFGFSVINENGERSFSVMYRDQDTAEQARTKMAELLSDALRLFAGGS